MPRDAVADEGNVAPCQATPGFLSSHAAQTALARLPEEVPACCLAMPRALVDHCISTKDTAQWSGLQRTCHLSVLSGSGATS